MMIFFLSCDDQLISDWQVPEFFEGELLWVKLYGGSDEDIAHSIIETNDGGFAVLGNTKSNDGDISGKNTSDRDWFFLKLDHNGDILWKKVYGGSGDDHGHSVIQTQDGGYILVGYTSSKDGDINPNDGFDDIKLNGDPHDNWIIKIDQFGNIIWEDVYGFKGHDHAYSIIPTIDGGYFFNGFLDVTSSQGEGNDYVGLKKHHGVGEFWCHKIDQNGNLQWRKYYGGSNNDRSYDAIETEDGDFLIIGTSESLDVDISSPKGSYDIWAILVNSKGEMIWENSFGGSGIDQARAVIKDFSGNYKIIGSSFSQDKDVSSPKGSSDIWIVTIDKFGNLINENSFGGSDFDSGMALVESFDKSIFIIGHSRSSDIHFTYNAGENDIVLLHITAGGELIETFSLGGDNDDLGNDIIQTSKGEIVIAGETRSQSNHFLSSKGDVDIVVAMWR